jgi:hypothetical protein
MTLDYTCKAKGYKYDFIIIITIEGVHDRRDHFDFTLLNLQPQVR